MLLALLFITQVTCDWVEIAQNTYKKDPPRRATTINRYEEPKDDRIYRNNSIVEKQWKKATIDRVTNVDDVRQVYEPSVRTQSMRPSKYDSTKLSDTTNLNTRRIDPDLYTTIHNPFHEEEIPTKWRETTRIEFTTRPSKTESVKLQTINSELESNVRISSNNISNRTKITIHKDRYDSNKGSDENKIYKEDENIKFVTVADDSTSRSYDDDPYDYRIRNFQRVPTTALISPENDMKTKSYFIGTTPVAKTTRIDTIFNKENTNYFHKIENYKDGDYRDSHLSEELQFLNISTKTKSKFNVTKVEKPIVTSENKINKLNPYIMPNLKDSSRVDLSTKNPEAFVESEEVKETKSEDFADRLDEISNSTKTESMGKMWNFVKIVTDTIYKNTHRSIKSKVNYLERLKSTILASIEEHFENVFPDDVEHRGHSRRARSSQARGHVEFPSSESTLMTISFLTFAVFLIKLVLQVIHTYKNKTMMVTPTVVAAMGRAAAAIRSKS